MRSVSKREAPGRPPALLGRERLRSQRSPEVSPTLALAHYCAIAHPINFYQSRCLQLAREAVVERDSLVLRVRELEEQLAEAKRAILYPMTDLA
jgi:hypothetical protein